MKLKKEEICDLCYSNTVEYADNEENVYLCASCYEACEANDAGIYVIRDQWHKI